HLLLGAGDVVGLLEPGIAPVHGEAVGKTEPIGMGDLPRAGPELHVVMADGDRLHPVEVDPRPDDMAMLAALLLVEDDGTRLSGEAELALDVVGGGKVLLAADRRRRADGEA